MKPTLSHIDNQSGSAMVVAVIILALLTIIGHLATRSTSLEVKIASNDMRYKQAFYTADGMTELGSELLEQNIACSQGFTANPQRGGLIDVQTIDFWKNDLDPDRIPSDADRDIRIPISNDDTQPHTNIVIGGVPAFGTGSALQVAAGYEGKGKSTAGGGAYLIFDQIAQHRGNFNTESIVRIQWRHVIGTEGICDP